MPVINGVYTKDFPALGRAPIDTDIIPIAEVANQITYKTTLGEIFNAKVFGTTGRLSKFTSANTLGNSILNEIGNAIHLTNAGTSYASFGIINPGTPGDPGIDNDAYIGSTINNDFTIRVNNVEAARFDTALRFKIANIQNADTDTDKFLVSDGGVVKYRTGTELRSDIGAGVGSVTSVGLTMPVAFNVANSPIESAGTLAVTAVGTASQYIRGDGQLATLPTGAGGGSAVNYYLNGSVASGVAGYQQMDNTAIIGAGTDFTLTGDGLIAQFLTDAGNPNRLLIPGGAWNLEMFFSVSSSGGNAKFYAEVLEYDGTTFTSIASGITTPEEITGGTSIDLYLTSLAVPETALLITDRLAIRVYIVDNSGGRTVTLHTEDNTLCQVTTTFAGGISALNGLTANTQYFAVGTSGTDFNISSISDTHTFNLPTASATKRGALSASDWNTFNNKQPAGNYVTLDTNQTIAGEKTFTAGNIFIDSRSYFAEDNGQSGQAGYTQMITLADSFSFINGATTKAAQFIYGGGVRSYTLPSANGTLALTSQLHDAVTLSAIGSTPNANGATLTGQVLNLQPASASFGGVVTTGAQTISGAKTFSVDAVVNGLTVGHGGGNLGSNTVVGFDSLFSNTTGENNTGNGIQSLFSNTTGIQNSAFGASSLLYNTTGDLNSSFGSVSLRDNTSGSSNSSFGAFSLLSNTTGYGNIAMGYYAGAFTNSSASNLTSNNSVYLGNDTSSSASGNTNEIVIGAYARGGGSNSATLGNTSIATTILHGNTSIGYTTNPSLYRLDVNGTGRFADNVRLSKSSNSGSGSGFPRFTVQNTLATQGDGSSTFNFADINISSGNEAVNLFLSTTYAAGVWDPAAIINVSTNHSLIFKTNNTTALTIASTGAATFSSSVTANSGFFGPTSNQIRITSQGAFQNATLNGHIINGDGTGAYSSGDLLLQPRSASGAGANIIAFGTSNNTDTVVERMRITSGGYTKASNDGSYNNPTGLYHELRNNQNDWTLFATNTNAIPFGFLIKYTSASPNGTSNRFIVCADSTTDRFEVRSNGNVLNTNGSYGAYSDIKLKENIKDSTPKLEKLLKVKIRNYNLIGEETKQIGVIAQELEEIFPSMIDESEDFEELEVTDEDGNTTTEKKPLGTTTKSVKYSVFVPMLIKAIQEQQAQIKELKQLILNK